MRPPIINGSIVPFNTVETTTYRDVDTGITTMFVMLVITIFGGLVTLLSTRKWWLFANMWSYARIVTLWFWSIAFFATTTFIYGKVNRFVMAAATLHLQVEILLCCLLLGFSAGRAMTISFLFGIITYACDIGLNDIRNTFIIDSFIGYGIDLYHVILLAYGRRWLFALGAAAHAAAAALTFFNFVVYPGPIADSLSGFLTAAFTVLFTTAGVMYDREDRKPDSISQDSFITLLYNPPSKSSTHRPDDVESKSIHEGDATSAVQEERSLGYLRNPMSHTRISTLMGFALWFLALGLSAAISFPLNYSLSGAAPQGSSVSQDAPLY